MAKKNGKRKLKKKAKTSYELSKEMRGLWHGVVPVTKIMENKQLDTTKRRQAEKVLIQNNDE